MRLHEFLCIVNDEKKLIDYLISHRVIREKINCSRCNSSISLSRNINCFLFHFVILCIIKKHKKCLKTWCNFKISALHRTWFSQTHFNIQTVYRFIAYFLMIRPPMANVFGAGAGNIIKNSYRLGKFLSRSMFCNFIIY